MSEGEKKKNREQACGYRKRAGKHRLAKDGGKKKRKIKKVKKKEYSGIIWCTIAEEIPQMFYTRQLRNMGDLLSFG